MCVGKPLKVKVDFYIQSISSIDEVDMVSCNLFMRVTANYVCRERCETGITNLQTSQNVQSPPATKTVKRSKSVQFLLDIYMYNTIIMTS